MKNKKLKLSILSLALVAVVGIGGTLAYLSTKTNDKTNTFTMGTAISGDLTEPGWDSEGKTQAEKFTPGRVITKDPRINNTSPEGTDNAYVAVKLTYTGDVTSAADILKFADIDWNTADWDFNEDYTMAIYKHESVAGTSTENLFNTVTIKRLALTAEQIATAESTNPQFDKTQYPNGDWANYEMKNFDINLQGYLVQTDGFDTALDAMTAAFPNDFVMN